MTPIKNLVIIVTDRADAPIFASLARAEPFGMLTIFTSRAAASLTSESASVAS
jgi:hypothetical protein